MSKAHRVQSPRAAPFTARIPIADKSFPLTVRHLKPLMVEYGYLHRHPEFEICYFPADSGTFMIQDREYPIRPGDVFIVNGNDIHQPVLRTALNQGAIATYFSCRIFADANESGEWLNPFILASRMGANRIKADRRLRQLIQELHQTVAGAKGSWQLASRGILMHILSLIACDFIRRFDRTDQSASLRGAHRFGRVIAYINDHLHEPISAANLYRLAGLSHSQFSVRFRSTFGLGVAAYIQAQRISRAKRLLKSTSMAITQIALSTGFSSSSFFNRVFKKHVGTTPLLYRSNSATSIK